MSSTFLYYFVKFWGLAPFAWTKSSRAYVGSSKDVLHPSVLVLLCVIQLFGTIKTGLSVDFAVRQSISNISYDVATYIGIFSSGLCLITFVLRRNKLVQIINASYKIDGMLAVLGIEQNHEEMARRCATAVGLSSAAMLIVFYGCCFIWWFTANSVNTFWSVYSILIGTLIQLIHHHVDLLFVITMNYLRRRYEQLNDRLVNVCERNRDWCSLPGNWKTLHVTEVKINRVSTGSGEIIKPLEKLRKVAELFEILHTVTDNVVGVVSLPIIVNLAYYFTLLLTVVYHLFVTMAEAYAMNNYTTIAQLFSSVLWVSVMLCELFAIAAVCSLTEKTVSIPEIAPQYFRRLLVE